MLTLKYSKKGSAIYISHIDLLRQFIKILNRAEIEVSYSGGYHPHMNIFFSPALPLGVESDAEYCTIECQKSCIIDMLNDKSIKGLEFIEEFVTESNPKLAAKVAVADYEVECCLNDGNIAELENFLTENEILMELDKKGETVIKNVKPLILSYRITKEIIFFRLAVGNPNLRIDSLIRLINKNTQCNLKITDSKKTEQFIMENDALVGVDRYLKSQGVK